MCRGEVQRERVRENLKQIPRWAQSLMLRSISGPWDHDPEIMTWAEMESDA